MRILMVSSFLPYPLFSGGQVRLYNLIKELSQKHEITLICEKRPNQTTDDVKMVEKICKKVIVVARGKQWSLKNLLKTSFSSRSFLITGHTNTEMKKKIEEELVKSKFDLIHVETFYVMQNLPEGIVSFPRRRESIDPRSGSGMTRGMIPVVLVEHNIEYQVYQKYVNQVSILLRPLLSLDIAKIKKDEQDFWKKADRLVAVSKEDKMVIESAGVYADIVANGVDTKKFDFKQKAISHKPFAKKLLFIGDFKWIQNTDALRWIINEIFPNIKNVILERSDNVEIESNKKEILSRPSPLQDDTGIKLWIVGRKIPDSIKNLTTNPSIIFDEEASAWPTEELFQEADILLAPIRVGGGTSYKILESMSCGTPVVTTPLSAGAIGAKDSENIMVGEDATDLAEKTVNLLSDNKLYQKIANNGRKLIEEKYTWQKIAGELDIVYNSVIASD